MLPLVFPDEPGTLFSSSLWLEQSRNNSGAPPAPKSASSSSRSECDHIPLDLPLLDCLYCCCYWC